MSAQKDIVNWLIQEGFAMEPIKEEGFSQMHRIYRTDDPEIKIIISKGQNQDKILVSTGFLLSDSDKLWQSKLTFEERREILTAMSLMLNSSSANFQIGQKQGIIKNLTILKYIFSDGLTKDRLISSVIELYKIRALAIILLRDYMDKFGSERTSKKETTDKNTEETTNPQVKQVESNLSTKKSSLNTGDRFKKSPVLKGALIGIVTTISFWIIWGGILSSGMEYTETGTGMEPTFYPNDIIVKQGNIPFDNIKVGDLIIYHPPSNPNQVYIHRVIKILNENPLTVMTKGDANSNPIDGIDSPITENEYIGKVSYAIPQGGYFFNIISLIVISGIIFMIPIIIMKIRTKRQFSQHKDYV